MEGRPQPLRRTGSGFLGGLLAGAATKVVSNVVGTVSGEVSDLISQKSDLYQQDQAQQAQIRRQEQQREANTRYYSVCPFCDGANQNRKFCAYCDSSLAYIPDEVEKE